MRRWMILLACALMLSVTTVACGTSDEAADPAPAADEATDGGDSGESADEMGGDAGAEDADEGEADEATPEAGGTDGDSAEGEGAEQAAQPTLNPTTEAIAQTFEPPVKGDPDAPVMIYEFSDYL